MMKKWHPKIIRYASLIVKDLEAAKDIAQECWQSIIKGLPQLKDPSVFSSWTYRIAHNKSIDWLRRNKRDRVFKEDFLADQDELTDEITVTFTDEMSETEKLRATLNTLPDNHKLILTLFYLEEQSLKQIGKILSLPEGTVKSRLFYAREQLKKKYKELNHEKV